MNVSGVILAHLAAGVRHIFGYPGVLVQPRSPGSRERPLVMGARIDPAQYAAQF